MLVAFSKPPGWDSVSCCCVSTCHTRVVRRGCTHFRSRRTYRSLQTEKVGHLKYFACLCADLFLSLTMPLILHWCLVLFSFFLFFSPAIRCFPWLSPHLPFRLASVVDPTLVPCHHCALNFVWLRMRWLMRRSDPLLHHSWSFWVFLDGAFSQNNSSFC